MQHTYGIVLVVIFLLDQQGRAVRHSLFLELLHALDVGIYYCIASKDEVSVESNRAAVMVDGENKVLSL